jgi:Thioesterase domain
MAKLYAEAILALQPQGPYYIVGMCFGGLVGIEIARLLTESGGRVALLALLDAYPHPKYWPTRFWLSYFVIRRVRESFEALWRLPPRDARKFIVGQTRKLLSKSRSFALLQRDPFIRPARPLPRTIQAVLDQGILALEKYRPRYYSGDVNYLMCGYHDYVPEGPAAIWTSWLGRLYVDCAPVLATPEQIARWIFEKTQMVARDQYSSTSQAFAALSGGAAKAQER